MNIYTIRRATQGLADTLNASGLSKKVALAHDSRHKGELFCREAARVLAANGITAYVYPRLEPTPALSWAVRYLGCGAGICVTASHNPAQYNGYKVYGADGCQITLEMADHVLAAIGRHDYFDSPKLADYDEAVADGRIVTIDDQCLFDFVDAVLALRPGNDVSHLKLVYTPLNGTGLEPVKLLLGRMGVTNVTVVPQQEKPDGDFPTCPYPNPEIRQAMETGLKLCDTVHPDLMIGTDPDCDRMGAAVPDGQGGYRLITGNEMGVLLFDYICRTRQSNGTMPKAPVGGDHHCLHRHGHPHRRQVRRGAAPHPHRLQVHRRADRPAGGGRSRGAVHLRLRGELRLSVGRSRAGQGRRPTPSCWPARRRRTMPPRA